MKHFLSFFFFKEQSDIDTGKEQHQSHLVDLKEQTEKMERLVKFLEEEKSRLQDKMEKMMAAGQQQRCIFQQTIPMSTHGSFTWLVPMYH